MNRERFTITTKGSRTVVHWEGKCDGPVARATSTGRFPADAAESSAEVPKKRRAKPKGQRD